LIKENMIVAGGTGSGKTTLLNILSSLIPNEERILTIEDSAELQLNQEHIVPFESRPPDKFGKGGVDMGDLLQTALRLRPDRIVVGEVRGGECFHLMQAMNTGHGGSLATTHANTPTDTLRRLESLCLMSSVELPLVAIRAQVASAINIVICCERLQDGSRKVSHVSEVLPLNEKGDYRTQDIFIFTPLGKDSEGRIFGYHAPTGVVPHFIHKAKAYGFADMTEVFFDPATYGLPPPPNFHAGDERATKWAPSLKHREQGQPDPERFKQEWEAYEHKLREKAELARKSAPSPAAPKPKPATPVAAAAKPAAPAPARSPGDKTPPPTRRPPPPPVHEPLVQVDQALLDDVGPSTDIRETRAPAARPAAGVPNRRPVSPKPLDESSPDVDTNVGPIPVRPKR
jgi:pilus assembly protein CpaF